MAKKRILIISGESWRDESNGGNVLSNLFGPLKDEFEFAQIYTNANLPSNNLCTHYFHISEGEVIQAVLQGKKLGRKLTPSDLVKGKEIQQFAINGGVISFIKKYLLNFAFFVQDIFWRKAKWKTPELDEFILEFKPDIVFAPMYYSLYLHRIDRYVANLTGKKIISYVSDDHLTFKHFSISPFFWLNRFLLRKNVIHTSKYYSLLYTMTEEQLQEYQPILKVPMKVLKKTGPFDVQPPYKIRNFGDPIVITYGGNLIYNRYKTLGVLANAIKNLNKGQKHFILNIYTQTPITKKIKELLDDGENTFIKGRVSMAELNQHYASSDIVLHVESFELKQKLQTRLSFSTKIIDLLHSGRCIMAICWKKSAPYRYLKKQNAAICVSDLKGIEAQLTRILDDESILTDYADHAWRAGVMNHRSEVIIAQLKKDLATYL